MSHTLKNITVFFDLTHEGIRILKHAGKLAHRFNAHLIAVYATISSNQNPYDGFALGREAASDVTHRRQAAIRTQSEQAIRHLESIAKHYDLQVEFRAVDSSQSSENVSHHSFYCDLVIAGTPQLPGLPPDKTPEQMLLKTGVPSLIIPTDWPGEEIGQRIVIAWNASRVARRAVADAIPMLVTAPFVRILIVDPDDYGHGEEPGADLAIYLARHGVNVEVLRVGSEDRSIVDVIIGQAKECDADLVVLGAYSRSRFKEMVLGGVTRDILSRVPLPLFVSH